MHKLQLLTAGMWMHGIDPDLGTMLLTTEDLCFELNSLAPSRVAQRRELIDRMLGEVGENCVLHSPFHCDFGFNIRIGHHFVGNYNLTILDEAEVTIGNHVFIGPNVSIYTITHALNAEQRNAGVMAARPIVICDNVWIGGNVVILPGVTIGEGAVIGAGSVVTKDIPSGTLCVGNPCRVIRQITDADRVETSD